MGQCACKEAAIEVEKDVIAECAQPSGASSSSETTDADKAPGCYNSSSAESTQSSSSLSQQLDIGLPGASARRALLLRGAAQRRNSGTSSSAGQTRRKDSLSTVDSFDGTSSELSVSFSVAEAPRFGDPASSALLEASARRLANGTPTPVVGTDMIVERLRNLERKIPSRPSSGRDLQASTNF